MPMNEALLKVELSPSEGQMFGTFTEGMPIAEALEHVIGIQVDSKLGYRRRHYGRVIAVEDHLLNIDNVKGVHEQVERTVIHFVDSPPLTIIWLETAVAVAEIAIEQKE